MNAISEFDEASYLRVFPASRELAAEEQEALKQSLRRFVATWSSHEVPVRARFELREDRFVLVAADESAGTISGCAKDALVAHLRAAVASMGFEIAGGGTVFYRDGSRVRAVDREEFSRLAGEGAVRGGTPVFDTTLSSVGALKTGGFERPARDSWHARVFDLVP